MKSLGKESLDLLIKILTRQAWIDEGMTWNPTDYGNLTILAVAVIEYWTPGLNEYS